MYFPPYFRYLHTAKNKAWIRVFLIKNRKKKRRKIFQLKSDRKQLLNISRQPASEVFGAWKRCQVRQFMPL